MQSDTVWNILFSARAEMLFITEKQGTYSFVTILLIHQKTAVFQKLKWLAVIFPPTAAWEQYTAKLGYNTL